MKIIIYNCHSPGRASSVLPCVFPCVSCFPLSVYVSVRVCVCVCVCVCMCWCGYGPPFLASGFAHFPHLSGISSSPHPSTHLFPLPNQSLYLYCSPSFVLCQIVSLSCAPVFPCLPACLPVSHFCNITFNCFILLASVSCTGSTLRHHCKNN